jgi:hypothetical protein
LKKPLSEISASPLYLTLDGDNSEKNDLKITHEIDLGENMKIGDSIIPAGKIVITNDKAHSGLRIRFTDNLRVLAFASLFDLKKNLLSLSIFGQNLKPALSCQKISSKICSRFAANGASSQKQDLVAEAYIAFFLGKIS